MNFFLSTEFKNLQTNYLFNMEYKGFTIQETTGGWMMLGKYEYFKQGGTCHFATSIEDAQEQIDELTAND